MRWRSSACISARSVPGGLRETAYRVRERAPHLLDLSFTAWIGTLLVGSVRSRPIRIGEGLRCCLVHSQSSRRFARAVSGLSCLSAHG